MKSLLKTSGALHDETRITILAFLLKYGSCCVCELSTSLALGQSRISRHLGLLQDAGFLETERNGKWIYYSIQKKPDPLIAAIFNSITTLNLSLPKKIAACTIKENS